jgi:hypothetical protein
MFLYGASGFIKKRRLLRISRYFLLKKFPEHAPHVKLEFQHSGGYMIAARTRKNKRGGGLSQ